MTHDNSYKLLFTHPEMVTDLLKGFVHEPWLEHCDFSTLEKMGSSYITDDIRDREDDIIWRIRYGEEWLYVYLLLEFQSGIDHFMAVRIAGYISLLYQDLIRSQKFTSKDLLPPVLPIVLYNGKYRWHAPIQLSQLIEVHTMLAERVKEWVEEWKEEGLQEGLQKGLQKGEAKLFVLLLKSKFGSVNQQIQDKVNSASPELLESWAEQIFDATSPEDLLNS